MPKISVILPVYNGEKYLSTAIDSILKQTYRDFEFIIINDCSTDRTEEIIKSYKDTRIVYLKNEINYGISKTLNRGIDKACGEYIARMDADDISLPERFEKQVNYMERNKNIGVIATNLIEFTDENKEVKRSFEYNCKQIKANALLACPIAHPTVMIRRSILDKNHYRYEERYEGVEDYYLWWNISKVSDIAILPEYLLKYRIHPNQVSKKMSPEFYEVLKEFMNIRLSVFENKFTDVEFESIFKYSLGKYTEFKHDELFTFIKTSKKILESNKQTKYFDQKALNKVLGPATLCICNNSKFNEKEKKEAINYAKKVNIISKNLSIRLLVHKLIKR